MSKPGRSHVQRHCGPQWPARTGACCSAGTHIGPGQAPCCHPTLAPALGRAMRTHPTARLLPALALAFLTGTGCTVTKPLVCAVALPAKAVGNPSCLGACNDARALGCAFMVLAAVGAAGGLVTGFVSDIQFLCGATDDPTHNLADPFAVN